MSASSGTSRSRTSTRRPAGRSSGRGSSTSAARRRRPRTSPIALWLTRGARKTFPVLVSSTAGRSATRAAIIAALDEYRPDPPLYPGRSRRPAARARDRVLLRRGARPAARALIFHDLRATPRRSPSSPRRCCRRADPRDPGRPGGGRSARPDVHAAPLPGRRRGGRRGGAGEGPARRSTGSRWRSRPETAPTSSAAGFSVADLTAAALFTPIVQPPEGPHVGCRAAARPSRSSGDDRDRPGYRWVPETFARDRGRPPALTGYQPPEPGPPLIGPVISAVTQPP